MTGWSAPGSGDTPGVGNDRPQGGAELKPELDPGSAAVRYLYDNARVDAEWSVREERGYVWWGHDLAQHVWSDPGVDDDGFEIFRVNARTDLVRDVEGGAGTLRTIDTLNGLSAGSALVLDRATGTIASVASMWVHEDSRDWVARAFSVIAAIQVAQAQQQAAMLAPLVGGEMAVSQHPRSGPRSEPDEMLSLLDVVEADGHGPSRWSGVEMLAALEQVRELPIVTLASGDVSGMAIEVPYRQTSALIQLDTREAHPGLGNGMVARLSLPGDAGPGPEWAAMRNQQELSTSTRSHFLGSWVGSADFATFIAFYPNMVARTSMGVVNVAISTINRAMWIATDGRATED